MCGIIVAVNKTGKVNEWVVDQFEEQHSRGTQGFGIALIDEKEKCKVLRACETTKALLDLYSNPSNAILMHHRTPTSSGNFLDQTHPILVSDGSLKYDYLVVHNGIIHNEDEIKAEHEKLGFVYRTEYTEVGGVKKFNDSEALAIEIARFAEKQTEEIGTRGSAAFAAFRIGKKGKNEGKLTQILFGRNEGSPLNLSASRNKVRISSEGEGEEVKAFMLYSFSLSSYKFEKRKMTFAKIEPYVSHGTSIGFNKNIVQSGYKAYTGEDYVFGRTAKKEPNPVIEEIKEEKTEAITGNEIEKEGILFTCQTAVKEAVDDFLEELRSNDGAFYPEAGDTLKDIANALYQAQTEIEVLATNAGEEQETVPALTDLY